MHMCPGSALVLLWHPRKAASGDVVFSPGLGAPGTCRPECKARNRTHNTARRFQSVQLVAPLIRQPVPPSESVYIQWEWQARCFTPQVPRVCNLKPVEGISCGSAQPVSTLLQLLASRLACCCWSTLPRSPLAYVFPRLSRDTRVPVPLCVLVVHTRESSSRPGRLARRPGILNPAPSCRFPLIRRGSHPAVMQGLEPEPEHADASQTHLRHTPTPAHVCVITRYWDRWATEEARCCVATRGHARQGVRRGGLDRICFRLPRRSNLLRRTAACLRHHRQHPFLLKPTMLLTSILTFIIRC